MLNFILILVCFFLGYFLKKRHIFPENTSLVLNRFVISISLPALTFSQMYGLKLSQDALYPISLAWITFFLGLIFFTWVQRRFKLPQKTLGALILTASLGNTSFVGFPLLEALFGAHSLKLGILVDQPGTFLVAGTLGVATACIFSKGFSESISPLFLAKKVFTFPPLIALFLSMLLSSVTLPKELFSILDRLGSTLIPLSLVSVGALLDFHPKKIHKHWKNLCIGLGFKLILIPLFFALFYAGVLHQRGESIQIILVESAMAPMITAGILAHEYGLDSELANLMIGIGIPLSLITVPIWYWIFSVTL